MQNDEKAIEYYKASKELLLELVNSFPDYAEFKGNLDWVNNRIKEQAF